MTVPAAVSFTFAIAADVPPAGSGARAPGGSTAMFTSASATLARSWSFTVICTGSSVPAVTRSPRGRSTLKERNGTSGGNTRMIVLRDAGSGKLGCVAVASMITCVPFTTSTIAAWYWAATLPSTSVVPVTDLPVFAPMVKLPWSGPTPTESTTVAPDSALFSLSSTVTVTPSVLPADVADSVKIDGRSA